MASELNMEKQDGKNNARRHILDVSEESSDIFKHLLPAAVSSSQDGEQAMFEGLASEQEASERRRSGTSECRRGNSPSAYQRPVEELPRLNFQIPRKNKERKALFQHMSTESREFEEVVKILSSCYRESSSAGTFSYTKARLVHSEVLEKDFIEKRKELKQDGRTDKELLESYGFLLLEPSKLHWICEKGLCVGHCRITTLGNPAMGVYLSKYSDLLQKNTFDLGATGEIVIFKVMKGKVKSIYDNMTKNLDPTPKFDCHVSKNANKVTSLRSFRAFELTQQYFYEYSFDEIKSRPRHVCPYAVVSFFYKGTEATPPPKPMAPLRSNSISDGIGGKSGYTVWSGELHNRDRVVYQVCLRSSTRPILPFKLPEKLEIGTVMNLDQVKRRIPTVLFSWDTYSGTREVLKREMYCSLFQVVDKSKQGNGLSGLLQKLERERLVLVNTLVDKGFLFLLSSLQMVNPNAERQVGWTRCLQALFVFQEPRGVSEFSPKRPATQDPLSPESQNALFPRLDAFIPALHYALMKVRANPPVDLGAGVERQARDYLSGQSGGKVRPYFMNEYKQNLDEREKLHPAPRQKHGLEGYLRSYIYSPNVYTMAVMQVKEMVESLRCPPEYSPVSDWEGSDSQPPEGAPSNGADNDPEKMKELLKLIQMCKRSFEGDVRQGGENREEAEAASWVTRGLKRKLELETAEKAVKYLRSASLDNGERSRDEHDQRHPSLSAVMDSMGLCDTDLRKEESQSASRLMKILATFNTATAGSAPARSELPASLAGRDPVGGAESVDTPFDGMIKLRLPARCDIDLRNRPTEEGDDEFGRIDYLEEQTAGSMSSLEVFSPCSSSEQHRGTENLGEDHMPWVLIPITGLKSDRYCLTEEDNPEDPRFLLGPEVSKYPSPEKTEDVFPEPVGDGHMETGGEVVLGTQGSTSPHPHPQKAALDSVDGILDEELCDFSTEVQNLLKGERVHYSCGVTGPVLRRQQQQPWTPTVAFSDYVSHYFSPVPVQSYVSTLCERMSRVIGSEPVDAETVSGSLPALAPVSASSVPLESAPATHSHASEPLATAPQRQPPHNLPRIAREVHPRPSAAPWAAKNTSLDGRLSPKLDCTAPSGARRGVKPELVAVGTAVGEKSHAAPPDPGPDPISSLISQLKPEVFSSLVEIIKDVQKNAVKFYIHSEEESDVCLQIKEYLMRLGNAECNPQSFLESKNSLEKLLIIIQNEDIAAHVHKIPALVSLKKLPSVSFAGVDSLDDVKNHTYNELFVSGGFIVSDEFVLNPDFITHERLQAFLKFLENRSTLESLWQWKVHCKSQKKLKELGRLNTDALSLLNLLTTYQKRHLVEFLPYHECDSPARHAPDLDCLVRLQAQHTQHRHIIFLTERRFEMFPHYANNGIVIGSIDEIMNSFQSLIGFHDSRKDPPAPVVCSPPAPVVCSPPAPVTAGTKDECVEEEDMSLDSEEDVPGTQLQDLGADGLVHQPPPPQVKEFRPPLPDQLVSDPGAQAALRPSPGERPKQLDFDALKSAISQFKATNQVNFEGGGASPGGFNVNPHQSFLCPSALQTSCSTSSALQTYPSSQEQGSRFPPPLAPAQCEPQERAGLSCSNALAGPTATPSPGISYYSWGRSGGVHSACGTPNSQDECAGTASTTPGNGAAGPLSSQGSLTPLSSTASQRPEQAGTLKAPRGGGGVNGRGRGPARPNCRGGPSNGRASVPGRRREQRGSPCTWGGRTLASTFDFTQDSYPWSEDYYSTQRGGYPTQRWL